MADNTFQEISKKIKEQPFRPDSEKAISEMKVEESLEINKKDKFSKLKAELFKTEPQAEVSFGPSTAKFETVIPDSIFEPDIEIEDNTNKASFVDEVFFKLFREMGKPQEYEIKNPFAIGLIDVFGESETIASKAEQDLLQEFRENKTKALSKINDEIENANPMQKHQFAVASGIAQALTLKSFPEISQPLSTDANKGFSSQVKELIENPEKATYLAVSIGADILRDMGLSMLTGGGYKAFVAWQSLNSSVNVYNDLKEQQRLDSGALAENNLGISSENAPATFAIMNGVVNAVTGSLAPFLTRKIFYDYVKKAVVNKALYHAATNAIENTAQNLTEQTILNNALNTKSGTNMFAVGLAGLMGGTMGYFRGGYGMRKQQPKIIAPLRADEIKFMKGFLGEDLVQFDNNKLPNKIDSVILGVERPVQDIVGDAINNIRLDAEKTTKGLNDALRAKFSNKGDVDSDIDFIASGLFGTVTAGGDAPPAKPPGRKFGENQTDEEFKVLNRQLFKSIKEAAENEGLVDPNVEMLINELPISDNRQKLMNQYFNIEKKIFEEELRFKTREVVKKDFAKKLKIEDPAITDKSIGDQFRKIYNDVNEMWTQFVQNVNDGMPSSPTEKIKHIGQKVAELNIDDLTKESNIADLFIKNTNNGVLDVDATVKDLQTRIKEVTNFKLYDGLTTKLNKILDAAGMDEKIPHAIEASGGKKYLSEEVFKKKSPGLFNLYEKYKQAAADLTPTFFASDNPWFESAQTMRMNLNRAAFAALNPNLELAITKAYYGLAKIGPNDGKLRSRLNKWFDDFTEFTADLDNNKIRKYMDVFDQQIRLKKDLNLENRIILGHKNIKVPKDIATMLEMTDTEIFAAHKLSNINRALNELRLLNESKVGMNYIEKVNALPEFHDTDVNFNGNMYHPVIWSEEGQAKLKQLYPDQFRIQDDPHPSMYKPRGYDLDMRSQTEFRLDALDETKQHFSKMASAIFQRPIRKHFEEIALQLFDMQEIHKYTLKNNFIDVKSLFKKHADKNQIAQRMWRVVEQHDNIINNRLTKGKIEELSGEVFAPIINGITRSVLSSPKIFFHIMNVAQPFGTLTPYLGFKNVLKNAPKGYEPFIKHFVKNKADISKTILNTIEGKRVEGNERFAERLDFYTKTYYNPEQIKGHYSFKGEDRTFKIGFKKNKFFQKHPKLLSVVELGERYLFDAMVASDFSSRVWGMSATLDYLDSVYKKYNWKPIDGDFKSGIKKITQIEKDLNLAGMGPIPYKELSKALHKGLATGDMKDFENKYIFHTLDSGLFHYDIANRHSLYDAARNRSKIASLAVRFTSWGLYDIELHRRIISDAWTKRNPEALGKALALYGIGLGIHYAIKKYGKEESELGKQANKFFYQRAPGTRLVDSLISRIDNPYGVIGSAAIQIKKTTQKANEGKFHYPSFLPKFPSVVSANDVKIMYRNIRDMVKKEGTKKEKDDIDIMGRALFDALDNPSNPEE